MALLDTEVHRAPGPQTALTIRRGKRNLGMKMDEVTLRSIVKEEIHSAVGFVGGDVSEDRRRAMDYYLGDPFGNEQEGRSSVVSTDVQDTIEAVMPDLLEIFAGGDEVVRFEPTSARDEDAADQATDYCNHIWNKDNDGFGISHDWIKDALLQKNGLIKVYWEDAEEQKRETFENLNSLALAELEQDEEVEIVEYEPVEITDPAMLAFAPDGLLHNVTVIRTVTDGRIKVVPIPPEEFLIARRSVSLGPDTYAFACHKTRKTASDLILMGYDPDVIANIPSHDEQDYNEERVARFDDDEWPELDDSLDPAMREIWLYECYLKVDWDGDGVTEMRQVTVAGPGYQLLENEAVDDHPFCSLSPIRMPHKFFGRSLADLTSDIQLIKSTIQRQLLDNMYMVNNGRTAISEKVDLDDYLTNRPGGAIRVNTPNPDVAGHITPIVTQSLGNFAYPLLEYWDGIRETRSGVTRLNQGLDPESLNKTATGINQLLGRTQRRILLMARVMAETGFRDAFRKMLNLVITHQERERIIRLRDEWVPMDPKAWNATMDVTVTVGLGYGTKEQQVAMLDRVLQMEGVIIQMQGGVQGPLITLDNIYNTYRKWLVAIGLKDTEAHVTDPENNPVPQQEPPPDPRLIEAQAKQQLEQQKLQIEQQRMQTDTGFRSEEIRLKWAELEAKHNIDVAKVGIEQDGQAMDLAKTRLDTEFRAGDMDIKRGQSREGLDQRSQETAEVMRQILSEAGGQIEQIAARVAEMERTKSAPKKVTIKRQNGRIVGAEIDQGGEISTVELGE